MNRYQTVPPQTLAQLLQFDTCTVSNAIETFGVRLRNEGFTDGTVRCLQPLVEPMLGYAVTGRIRTSTAPISGKFYYDRMDWWNYVASLPEPRVIVLQDVDHGVGTGAIFGEIHANICCALGCVGYVTNGAVRDLPALEALGFHVFASSVSVSHAYAHIIEFGESVEVGGLRIKPGDLLHGDRHGVQSIPIPIATEVPRIAIGLQAREQRFLEYLRSREFSLETLGQRISELI